MVKKFLKGNNKEVIIYFFIIALTALGLGLTNNVMSNYFKDAYDVTAYQRGLIEFPRELPGVMCIFIIAALSFLGDIRLSIIAQFLSIIGIIVLGFSTPSFSIMLIFLFINSIGMHLFFPLQDSIGMSLINDDNVGKKMGQYKGVSTAFSMFASILVFFGFRTGFFSFTASIKLIFIVAAVVFGIIIFLFLYLHKLIKTPKIKNRKINFVFRKEYKYYYILTTMYGVQKQIMMVYGPWVLIELLNKRADTLAILGMIGAFIGIFFIPAIGRWLDRFGIKTLLYADAISFIGVYILYGSLSAGFASGSLSKVGIPVMLVYLLFIVDRMSMQMGMIKSVYLRSIAVKTSDITPTLSLGISMDHVVSIICAYLGGVVWNIWGPQYIFFLAAALSFVNLYAAKQVVVKEK